VRALFNWAIGETELPSTRPPIVRPRAAVYLAVWCAIGLGMVAALSLRTPLSISVLHDRNPLFVMMRDGSISNGYDIKVLNMTPEPPTVTVALDGLDEATLSLAEHASDSATSVEVALEPDRVMSLRAYVQVAPAALPGHQVRFRIGVSSSDGAFMARTETTFEVPEQR
jgi:polyferredoxin